MNPQPASLITRFITPLLALSLPFAPSARAQVDGAWNSDGSGTLNWSDPTRWLDGDVATGSGSIADFSQLNITANRTVTIDTSRTVGSLLFGDINSTHGYTIAGANTLTFDNSGSGAVITQGTSSGNNTLSAPVLLADNLSISNNSASTLTFSTGGITSATVGTKVLTNAGTGTGGTTISGVIGNGSGAVAVVQDSATSQLTLSGANTLSGVTIKQGTLVAGASATAMGTGTVLLGDTLGTKDATLQLGSSQTYANAITVQAGSTNNTLTISAGALNKAVLSGPITLDNDLTFALTAPGGVSGVSTTATLPYLTVSGAIGGTGDLTLNLTGNAITSNGGGSPQSSGYTFSGPITTSGTLTDASTGTGWKTISGNISDISSLEQNSANSMLILSGTNTYSGETNINAGVLRSTSAGGLSTNSAVNVASGATLQLSATQSTTQLLTLSGNGTSYSSGALEAINTLTYAGNIALAADSTVASTLGSTTTLTLSGGITGAGKTLTTTGVANTTITGAIATGSGGLIKEGTGTTTLSGANTYTGLTRINQGALALSNANALGGGGNLTFNGGSLRLSSTNEADLGSRIVNSTGPVAIDTNARNVTYSGIDATNTGGLAKLGTGRLTLSGTNAFTGPIAVNAGVLAVSTTTAIPSIGTGQIFIDSNGALNTGGAYANVQAWLDSDNIAISSTGAIALTGNSSEAIDFAGYNTLSLGASSAATYTGTITAANSTYRLGGGGAALTLSGTNALTGTNGLVVGNGPVTLSGANNLSGATTVASNTLTLSGTAGSIAGSAVTVSPGATLAITSSTTPPAVTRAASVTLNRGTLTVTGNNTAHSTDSITGALNIGSGGNSTITLAQTNAKNALLTAASYTRDAGGTALIRGANLGVNSIASQTNTSTNIQITTPNLAGGVLVGAVGDTAVGGTGFGATGGLLTYDTTNGVRLLSGYTTSLTSSPTALDNAQLTSTSGVATTTLASDTTINSLSLKTSTATSAGIAINGAGKLTLNSGVLYSGSVTATTANTISNAIDFNDKEALILAGGSADLNLSGVLGGTTKGLTVYGNKSVILSGASANTYSGTTTVNGGTLTLNKTAGVNAITGNLVINSGGSVSSSAANQIADASNITINGGSLTLATETFNNLILNGGSATSATSAAVNVAGSTNLSNGGSITLSRSNNINGAYDSTTTLGALTINNTSSGAYTAITLGHGVSFAQSGAKLVLGGNVTFNGNDTNTNTVLIDAIKGSGRQGVIGLTATAGDRSFNIDNGAAATDLKITAALIDGSGASGLIKTGTGILALSGANIYSGNTTVSDGALTLADGGSLTFYIGATGVNNSVTGTGAVNFSGSFNFDLTGAGTTQGNSWTIVNVATLNESFTGTFLVSGFTETGVNSGVWTLGQYTFNEATGILAYGLSAVPEPSAYALLAGAGLLLFTVVRRKPRTSFSA